MSMVDRRSVLGGAVAVAAALPFGRALAVERVYTCSIALTEGRVWLAAGIGDNGPYLFILDTGGIVSLLDNELAKSLKLKEVPKRLQLFGIGGVSDFPWYDAGEVRFGNGIRLPHMLFAGTAMRLGQDARGSFGAGLFTSFDSDLDFVKGEWRTHPDGRSDMGSLVRLPSRFSNSVDEGSLIYADATVGNYSGEFLLDTGALGEVSLESRASAKSGLWHDDRPYAPMQARGIGRGRVPTRLVRVDVMKIGPFAFEKPLVMLTKPGSIVNSGDGVIGLKTLSRLHLSTQVSTRSVWAAQNGARLTSNQYPLSGLWIDNDDGRMTVADVGTGSPAAAAGLKVGDIIVGAEFRTLLRQINSGPGTVVPLTIERAGKRQDATLTLKPFL
jgi:serine protease Do